MNRTTPHPDAHRHTRHRSLYPDVLRNYVWRRDGVEDVRISGRYGLMGSAYLLGELGYGDAQKLSRFTIGEMR